MAAAGLTQPSGHHSQPPHTKALGGNEGPHVAQQLRLRPELALGSLELQAGLLRLAPRGSLAGPQRKALTPALLHGAMQCDLHVHHILQGQLRKAHQAAHGLVALHRQILGVNQGKHYIAQEGLKSVGSTLLLDLIQCQTTQGTKI